jgi:hypothetical protein
MGGAFQLGEQPVELIATVASAIPSQPSIIADELRRQADPFSDLVELKVQDRSRSGRPGLRELRQMRFTPLNRAND